MENSDFNEYDDELTTFIIPLFKEKIVNVVDSSEETEWRNFIYNSYANKYGRIQLDINDIVLSKSSFVGNSENDWILAVQNRLIEYCRNNQISDLKFILIGDNELLNAYSFKFKYFMNFFWHFFSIPQHTYLVSEDKRHLILYSFEDDLYFTNIN